MSAFLYEALECLTKFTIYAEGVAHNAKVIPQLQFLEVQTRAAVIPAGDRDVPSFEHVRIALARSRGNRLDERVVILLVVVEHPRVLLARLCKSVFAQDCPNVHAQVRVADETMKHFCCDASAMARFV